MNATQTRKPTKPQTRTAKLLDLGGYQPTLVLTVGKLTQFYAIEHLDSQLGGKATRLTKPLDGSGQEPEQYDVLLDGSRSTCECKGFLRHGMCADCKGCKHIAGLNAVLAKIAVPAS